MSSQDAEKLLLLIDDVERQFQSVYQFVLQQKKPGLNNMYVLDMLSNISPKEEDWKRMQNQFILLLLNISICADKYIIQLLLQDI